MSSELKWYGADVVKKMREATEVALTACALKVQNQVVELTPVADVGGGRLRASIGYKTTIGGEGDLKTNVLEGEAIVGTNVFYAVWVEFGTGIHAEKGDGRKTPWAYTDPKTGETWWTHGMEPKSFLRKGLDYTKKELPNIFKQYYDKIMK